MRKATLRRLEALEKREQQELSSLEQARMHAWVIVIAYYLGDLESSTPSSSSAPGTAQPRTIFRVMGSLDDPFEAFARDDPCEAFARALQYSSADDLENVGAVARLTHHIKVVFEAEQLAKSVTENGVVVCKNDANASGPLGSRRHSFVRERR